MGGFDLGMSPLEAFFTICAVIGGGMFVVRFIIQLFGGHDGAVDTEIDVDNADVDHFEADASFKLLTLQGLTAFFMMFGLAGFVLLRANRVGSGGALGGAVAAGLGTVWLIGRIFISVKKLQSGGTLDNAGAIGEKGAVYLTIRAGGRGKVHIAMKGRLREFEAVSRTGEEIGDGERIVVTEVNGSVLVVEKA